MYRKCDQVLTYDCFLDDSLPCSISYQHFAHCPALNLCEPKSMTTDAISILEDSFVTYIESSKAKSFLLNVTIICNEKALIKELKKEHTNLQNHFIRLN